MRKKALLLKILAAILAVAAAACFAAPAVVKWTLLHQQLPFRDDAAAIGVIGGADGPTAIFVTAGPVGFSLTDTFSAAGGVLAAGAAGLWLWSRALSRKKQG